MGRVKLPVMPPVKPMLAKSVKDMPAGGVLYEPRARAGNVLSSPDV